MGSFPEVPARPPRTGAFAPRSPPPEGRRIVSDLSGFAKPNSDDAPSAGSPPIHAGDRAGRRHDPPKRTQSRPDPIGPLGERRTQPSCQIPRPTRRTHRPGQPAKTNPTDLHATTPRRTQPVETPASQDEAIEGHSGPTRRDQRTLESFRYQGASASHPRRPGICSWEKRSQPLGRPSPNTSCPPRYILEIKGRPNRIFP